MVSRIIISSSCALLHAKFPRDMPSWSGYGCKWWIGGYERAGNTPYATATGVLHFHGKFPSGFNRSMSFIFSVPAGGLHFIILSPACRASDWQTSKSMD